MDRVPCADTDRHVSHNRILVCNTDAKHSLLMLVAALHSAFGQTKDRYFQTPKCLIFEGQRLEVVAG